MAVPAANLTAGMLLLVAAAGPAGAPSPGLFDHEAASIEAGLQRWRGNAAYFSRKKGSFVCRTRVTSGDRKIDRLACAATVTCFNRHRDELNALLNMTGDIEAQHAAARHFRQKKNDCFRLEREPLIRELALRRVAGATR